MINGQWTIDNGQLRIMINAQCGIDNWELMSLSWGIYIVEAFGKISQ